MQEVEVVLKHGIQVLTFTSEADKPGELPEGMGVGDKVNELLERGVRHIEIDCHRRETDE